MLSEDGVIVTGDERWQITLGRLPTSRVPATLTGVLQARLDGLPPHRREVLQPASIVGRVFWNNIVERLHNPDVAVIAPPRMINERLDALNGKELILERSTSAFAETQEYVFKH